MTILLIILAWALSGVIPAYLAHRYWGDYYQASRANLVGIMFVGPFVPMIIIGDRLFTADFWSKDVFKGKS
jgi:hypothetical protein